MNSSLLVLPKAVGDFLLAQSRKIYESKNMEYQRSSLQRANAQCRRLA